MPHLTQEQKERLREQVFHDPLPGNICGDCGGYHIGICLRIKRLRFVGEGQGVGNRIEVEYWETWDDSDVIYPGEVWADDDEGI